MRQTIVVCLLSVCGCVHARHESIRLPAEGAPFPRQIYRLVAAWEKATHEVVRPTAYGEVEGPIVDLGEAPVDVYGAPARLYRQMIARTKLAGPDALYSLDLSVRRCSVDGIAAWKEAGENPRALEKTEELRARVRNGCVDESPTPADEQAFSDLHAKLKAALAETPIPNQAP